MKKILGLLLGLAAVSSFADEANGLYVGVGAGAGWNDTASPATAFRLDGGYQFTPGLAVEVGTTGVTQSGSSAYNADQQMYDVSVKGILPLGNMFDLFAQFGGAYQTTGVPASPTTDCSVNGYGGCSQAANSGWQFLSGGGFDINLTKQVSFNVTDLYYYGSNNALGNSNVLLGGVKFAF